ncbi:unnamed protein product [Psylliodes chrysocephalus]|uniref:Uncharacterized protein n=1 Tax=Psylliodes chrysocephalus TaxID=3402493 RepID=A0A9P0CNU3_9CUCU|nr:unnamed protein product [Psylliodes chrysocephala]
MSSKEDNIEAKQLSEEICISKKELEEQVKEIMMEMLSNLLENYSNYNFTEKSTLEIPGNSKRDSIENVNKQVVPLDTATYSTLQLVKRSNMSRPKIIFSKDTKDTPSVHDAEALATPQRKILVYPIRSAMRTPSRHYIIHAYDESRGHMLGDPILRKDFTSKIMFYVTVQLVITFALIFSCIYIKSVMEFIIQKLLLVFCVIAVQLVSFIIILCTDSARKAAPYNYILLTIFTLCSSYVCGYITLKYSIATDMLISTGITVAVLITVCLISWINLFDFTTWYYAIDILLLSTLIFYLISSVFYWVTGSLILQYIFFCLFFVVMIISLLHQMELILGKRKHAMDIEESLLAGVIVYVETLVIYCTLLLIIEGPT